MKDLIRNNIYYVEGSLKMTILIGFIAMIAIAGIYFPNNNALITSVVVGMPGAFSALAGTSIQKDRTSRWNKFELSMPISRSDVIKARYISFIIYIFVGICMEILCALLYYVVSGSVNLERMSYGFAFGFSFAMSIPTFMTPLNLIFGTDKNEALLMVSIAIGLILFLGSGVILAPYLRNFPNANLVFRLGCFLFSIILSAVSYFLHYIREKNDNANWYE